MRHNILIADDDPEDLELIEDAFLNVAPGAELHKFTSGIAAMEYLKSTEDDDLPCLIVLDYNMPELNGSQVLSSIKAQQRYEAIPKIVLSTSNASVHAHECKNNGATEYIVKPDNLKELRSLARRLLALCEND